MGYMPEIMSRRLKDSANEYHTGEVTNIKETILSYRYRELDIVLPEVGISIKSVANYFRDFFRRNLIIISGEMLYHEERNQISFRLRLNSEQIFNGLESFSEKGIITLINEAGYELTKRVNPFALAVYHYRKEEKAKAQQILNYIIKNVDKDKYDFARAINLKGVIHHNDGEYEEAISHYRWANDLDPSFVAPYTNWGRVLATKSDYLGAIRKIKEANKVDPKNVSTYVYWCRLLVTKKYPDWKSAIKKCMEALKLDPDNASAYLYWGLALMGKKDWEGAIQKYEEVLKLEPDNASAYINWGVALRNKTGPDLQGAIKKFEEALKHNPSNALAHTHWGIALMIKGDREGAIEQFKEALKHNPGNTLAHTHWGIALMGKREWEGAIEQFKEALRLDPNNDSAWINWGIALMYMRDWNGAIEKYKEVTKLKPMSSGAYNYIVIALIELGKNDIATRVQNCAHKINDINERAKCSELVLSL